VTGCCIEHWYDIVLNVYSPTEHKMDDTKVSFYEELQQEFDEFPRCRMIISPKYFSAKAGRQTFSNQQLGTRVNIKLVLITELQ
jgi:hypothetical protein